MEVSDDSHVLKNANSSAKNPVAFTPHGCMTVGYWRPLHTICSGVLAQITVLVRSHDVLQLTHNQMTRIFYVIMSMSDTIINCIFKSVAGGFFLHFLSNQPLPDSIVAVSLYG